MGSISQEERISLHPRIAFDIDQCSGRILEKLRFQVWHQLVGIIEVGPKYGLQVFFIFDFVKADL